MWTRKGLKTRGKAAFRGNYWRCVTTALILSLVTGGAAAGGADNYRENIRNGSSFSGGFDLHMLIFGVSIFSVIMVAAFLIQIFVFLPLEAGGRHFFSENSRTRAAFGELGKPFRSHFMHVVGTMLLRNVFNVLWFLLFVIPGIVKLYSYRMVPYLTADYPGLSATQTITLSRKMMDGEKWNVFVLDLSFILWYLLAAFTLNIVGVFYVYPYVATTDAELYRRLSEKIPSILGEEPRQAETFDQPDMN